MDTIHRIISCRMPPHRDTRLFLCTNVCCIGSYNHIFFVTVVERKSDHKGKIFDEIRSHSGRSVSDDVINIYQAELININTSDGAFHTILIPRALWPTFIERSQPARRSQLWHSELVCIGSIHSLDLRLLSCRKCPLRTRRGEGNHSSARNWIHSCRHRADVQEREVCRKRHFLVPFVIFYPSFLHIRDY